VKSLSESPAILTVHAGTAGQFIIKVGDLRYRPLIVGVTKLLPDAESLVVITPSDIRVYAVGGSNGTGNVSGDSTGELGHIGTDSVGDDSSEALDAETLAAIAKEEGRAIPGDADATPSSAAAAAAEVVGETPQGTKVVRRRKSPTPVAGHDEQCQRCNGSGKTKVLLDGGAAAETTCQICGGDGVMRRYGSKR